MIAFASLFLGLVFGVKPVEVVVGEGVAAVELRLDGESVGVMRQAPWTLPCDLGLELAPRLLEAVALDAGGRELGRASQWLNLPRPRAVLSAVLEPAVTDEPRIALLAWESAVGAEPTSVTATVDGEPVTVTDPRRLVLPAVDETQLHLLQVEMKFEERVTARVDLTFGGVYAEEVNTEITALTLWASAKGRRPPSSADAQDWFAKDGESLRVIAIEKGSAEVVVVMGRAFPYFTEPGKVYRAPKPLFLPDDLRLRFLSPVPEQSRGVATTFELFPVSPAYDGGLGDLYSILSRLMRPAQKREPRQGTAVAVAGLAAYEGRHRRAVVLIPTSKPRPDEISPAQALHYLERLRVPFYVWSPETKPATYLEAWGPVESAWSIKRLATAFTALREDLDRQWVVWLDGRHLPQDVELTAAAEGFSLSR